MARFGIDFAQLLPAQQKWWQLPNFIKLLTGGKRAGKTYIGGLRSIFLTAKNPGLQGMCVSPSFPIAKKTTIPQIGHFLKGAGIRYEYHQSDHFFYIPGWDGTIWIGSGEIPESLVGATLAWAWVDEPFLQKRQVLDEMIARVSDEKASLLELGLTGTPEELNWGYDLATGAIPDLDVGTVYASTLDNPHVPETTIKAMLASYTPEMQKAYLDGQFVLLTKGRVYKPFNRDKHIKVRDDLGNLPIIIGVDFNVDYLTAEIGRKAHWGIHWFDEIRLENATTYDLANELRSRYPGAEDVYPDPTGSSRQTSAVKSDHQILRAKDFIIHAREKPPRVKNRVNAYNRLLLNDRVSFDPKCIWLIKDMERDVWKAGGIDQSVLELTHAAAASGYPVELLYPIIGGEFFIGER